MPPSRSELVLLSSEEVVARTVESPLIFKWSGQVLERRPPDERAAARLCDEFDRGRAPAWLTAYLLGCIGARTGYACVREILYHHTGQLCESYAGVALAKIEASAAREDLLQCLRTSSRRRTREGALHGLGALGDITLLHEIIYSAHQHLVSVSAAAVAITRLKVPPEKMIEMLSAAETVIQEVALEAVLLQSTSPDPIHPDLRLAALAALEQGVKMSPQMKRRLIERLGSGN